MKRTLLPNPGIHSLLTGGLARYALNPGFMVQRWDDAYLIFLEPFISLTEVNGAIVKETIDGKSIIPGNILDSISSELSPLLSMDRARFPWVGGYLAYELLHSLEDIPRAKEDKLQLPDCELWGYRTIIRVPQNLAPIEIFERTQYGDTTPLWEIDLTTELSVGSLALANAPINRSEPNELERSSNFTREAFCRAVSEIKSRIQRGDIYQANLSQQFTMPFRSNPLSFWLRLERIANGSESSFISATRRDGTPIHIVSASPELYFEKRGTRVLCSPIKGTTPRGKSVVEDAELCANLVKNEKERAELSMIVDLVRNDLSRVCTGGSVEVTAHARVISTPYVYHLVSDIEGTLNEDRDLFEILRASFPCGSITGAPKISAMEIISSAEGRTRGAFCGSILSFSRDLARASVAIRTAHIYNGEITFAAGAGITIDSDEMAEYAETLSKTEPMLCALAQESISPAFANQ